MKNYNSGSYKELIIWQSSMDLVSEIYLLASSFPKNELYGLTSQMRRSAISIPSNIAEGKRRCSNKEFRKFLLISFASGAELETQIEISKRLNYVNKHNLINIEDNLNHIMKMLNKFISSLT